MSITIFKQDLCKELVTFSWYGISFYDMICRTHLCRTTKDVDIWIGFTSYIQPRTFALDIKYDNLNRPAILQLCIGRQCLAFQLLFAPEIPQSLKDLFNNPYCKFVGYGINQHVETLSQVYGLQVSNPVDIRDVAADSVGIESLRSADLESIVRDVLRIEIEKQEEGNAGNWGDDSLTDDQIKYASVDVLVLLEIKQHRRFRRYMEQPNTFNVPNLTHPYFN